MKTQNKKNIFYPILSLLLMFSFFAETNAQIFKKLQQNLEAAIEGAVVNKVTDETNAGVENQADKMAQNNPFSLGLGTGNLNEVPVCYEFDWLFVMNIATSKGNENLQLEYLLRKDAAYWGSKMGEGMTMVYDNQNNLTVMFMKNEGTSFASVTKMGNDVGEVNNEEDSDAGIESDYTIREIAGKVILGYSCKGYVIDNTKNEVTVYIAPDAEVRLGEMKKSNKKMPQVFSSKTHKELAEGLMMEMQLVDKKKSNNNMTMECVKLEKQDTKIKKADY